MLGSAGTWLGGLSLPPWRFRFKVPFLACIPQQNQAASRPEWEGRGPAEPEFTSLGIWRDRQLADDLQLSYRFLPGIAVSHTQLFILF